MKKTYYSKLFCAIVVVGLFMVFNNMSFAEEGKVYTDTDLKKYGSGSSNTKKLDIENPCNIYEKRYDECGENLTYEMELIKSIKGIKCLNELKQKVIKESDERKRKIIERGEKAKQDIENRFR